LKKVRYPNLDDYDLSCYEELKGDILYKINGGTTMSSADQAAMAEACKSGNAEKQAEIRAKYETKDSAPAATSAGTKTVATSTSTATSAAPTQTDAPAQSTALDHGQQDEMVKQDAERKTGGAGSSVCSGGSQGYTSSVSNKQLYDMEQKDKKNHYEQLSSFPSSKKALSNQQQDEMGLKTGLQACKAKIDNNSIEGLSLSGRGYEEKSLAEQNMIVPDEKNNGYPYYVDPKNKTVNADIHSKESIERAYSAYYVLQAKGYSFSLVDGQDVVHTFKDVTSVDKYVTGKCDDSNILISFGHGGKLALGPGLGVEGGFIVDKSYNIYAYMTGYVGVGIQTPATTNTGLKTSEYLLKSKGVQFSLSMDYKEPLDTKKISFSSMTTADICFGVNAVYNLNNLNSSGLPNTWSFGSFGGAVWKSGTVLIPIVVNDGD